MIKRLIPLSIVALLNIYTPASAKSATNQGYALIGSSSNHKSPLHLCLGINSPREITRDLYAGFDFNMTLENTGFDTGVGVFLERDIKGYSFGLYTGLALVRLDNQESNTGDKKENFLDGSTNLRISTGKYLNKKIKLKGAYQRNYAPEELFDRGYTKDRFSVGLETKL